MPTGGVEIETVAAQTPEKILRAVIDPAVSDFPEVLASDQVEILQPLAEGEVPAPVRAGGSMPARIS